MLAVALLLLIVDGTTMKHNSHAHAETSSPIGKVVNLMKEMGRQAGLQAKKEVELFDEWMCQAQTTRDALRKSIAEAEALIIILKANIKEQTQIIIQLGADIKQHRRDKKNAEEALSSATAIRENLAKLYVTDLANKKGDQNLCAKTLNHFMKRAGDSKRYGGVTFLQATDLGFLRRMSASDDLALSDADRDVLSSFLDSSTGSQDPPSSEIVIGMLNYMYDNIVKDIADMKTTEIKQVGDYEALAMAKKKAIKANQKAIETKLTRKGEASLALTKFQADLEDTMLRLAKDKESLKTLMKDIDTKQHEMDVYKKTHAEELIALAEVTKILNELSQDIGEFSAKRHRAVHFLQLQVEKTHKKRKIAALSTLLHGRRQSDGDPRLSLLALALQGRKGGSFVAVVKRIDKLVASLKQEQIDDRAKKKWCLANIDKTEDDIRWTARNVVDAKASLASTVSDLETVVAEIPVILKTIKDLDLNVNKSTKLRKKESFEFSKVLAESGATKDVLKMAKDRLELFYSPKKEKAATQLDRLKEKAKKQGLYKVDKADKGGVVKLLQDTQLVDSESEDTQPADSESAEGFQEAPSFVQVRTHASLDEGADERQHAESNLARMIKKKGEKVNGMLATLMADLDKEMDSMKLEEEDAQKMYVIFMNESTEKRAIIVQALADKQATKASVETELQKIQAKLKDEESSLAESKKQLVILHKDCDWLLKAYPARREAREVERDSLGKAKAVLNGANYVAAA